MLPSAGAAFPTEPFFPSHTRGVANPALSTNSASALPDGRHHTPAFSPASAVCEPMVPISNKCDLAGFIELTISTTNFGCVGGFH